MKKSINYVRVSTDEQAQSGYSLDHQRKILEQYCQLKGMQIQRVFVEDGYSAKNFDRPEWNKLMEYLKTNKEVECIVFTKWDRFSRNLEEALTVIRKLQNLGIEIVCMEQPLDLTIPDNKIILSIYLTVPQVENEKNSQRTRDGMREAQRQGHWMGKAPFGYKNIYPQDDSSKIEPSEKAIWVKESFELMATGLYAFEEARRKINEKWKAGICKQSFLDMFNRHVYKGDILIKAWKKEDSQIVKGIHKPIVSKELYNKVQEVLYGRKKQPIFHVKQSDLLPLRGHLKCPSCGRNLTGSGSSGRKRIKHWYYHCDKGCPVRFRADLANREFLYLLSSMKISESSKNLCSKKLRDIHKQKEGDKSKKVAILEQDIAKIMKRKGNAQDKLADSQIAIEDFNDIKKRSETQISNLQKELTQLKMMDANFLKYMEFTLLLVEKLDLFWEIAPVEIKKKLLVSIFPEKLMFDKQKYRTTKTNEVISEITRKDNAFRERVNEQAGKNAGLNEEGWPMGLEPFGFFSGMADFIGF